MWKRRSAADLLGVVEHPVQLGRHQGDERRRGAPARRWPSANDACSSSSTGSWPATSERQTTCSPATYDAGSASSHGPAAPEPAFAWRAPRPARRARDSTTRLGAPVEPEVSTTSGSGSPGAASQSRQRGDDLRRRAATGRRESMRRILAPAG